MIKDSGNEGARWGSEYGIQEEGYGYELGDTEGGGQGVE